MVPYLKQLLRGGTGNQTASGIGLGLLSGAATGSAFIFSKVIQQELSTSVFALFWFGLAGLYGLISHLYTTQGKALPHIPRRTWLFLLGIAVVNGIRGLAQHSAVSLSDPSLVSFLSRFTTVHALLLSVIILHERLSRTALSGSLLVVMGALAINYTSAAIDGTVVLLMIIATLAEASDIILAKVTGQTAPPTLMVAVRGLGTAAFAALLIPINGQWQWPSVHALLMLFIGAAISPFAGFFARYQGLRFVNAWVMGVLIAIQPLFTTLYSAIFLGELPDILALLGGLLLTGGVIVIIASTARSAQEQT